MDTAGQRDDEAEVPPPPDPDSDPRADPGPTTAELPSAVRGRVIDLAAATLSALPRPQVPGELTRIAGFAPGRRAKLGAGQIGIALDRRSAFRAAVAAAAASSGPAGDQVERAARAFLERDADLSGLLAELTPAAPVPDSTVALRVRVKELERALAAMTRERDRALVDLPDDGTADRLRQRLREQGTKARADRERIGELEAAVAEAATVAEGALTTERAKTREWAERARLATDRADRAELGLGQARESGRESRALADRRLDLLLSTLEGAATGLRREWDLIGGGADPAEVVAGRWRTTGPPAETTHDSARLLSWLQLPQAHLIVDGYNVTKTGYGELTLVQQRDRLVRAVAALSSRTGAEVTLVFDGAAVTVPQPAGRRVRVLFSPPGVIADDVVRDLAGAEPVGRVVVVVSSDKEVVAGARARGARTAASTVLLDLF